MTADSADPGGTDTIVLIHGLWVTALSWERWIRRYSARGYRVLAPGWPGMGTGIAELQRGPSEIADLGVTEIADHYDRLVRQLGRAPVLIGHSVGGLIVELLLDRGLGAAGVTIDGAPAKGTTGLAFPMLRYGFLALRSAAGHDRAVPLTLRQFRHAFTSTLSQQEAAAVWERYHIPGPGRTIRQVSFANLAPHAAARVDFERSRRPPLLLIAGGKDLIFPATVTKSLLIKGWRGRVGIDLVTDSVAPLVAKGPLVAGEVSKLPCGQGPGCLSILPRPRTPAAPRRAAGAGTACRVTRRI